MSDIFISYASDDREPAERLALALESQGWSVFRDRTIPAGQTWRSYIGKALEEARCVIVAWSAASLESDWVHEEADDARQRGVLVPVLIEAVTPPLGFRSIQAADLVGWDGEPTSDPFLALLSPITTLLGDPPAVAREEKRRQADIAREAEEEKKRVQADARAKRQADAAAKSGEGDDHAAGPAVSRKEDRSEIAGTSTNARPPSRGGSIKTVVWTALVLAIAAGAVWQLTRPVPPANPMIDTLQADPSTEDTGDIVDKVGGEGTASTTLRVDVEEVAAKAPSPIKEAGIADDCSWCPEMVDIPAGKFLMGSIHPDGNPAELPQHEVNIQNFAIGKTEVTFAQYDRFANATNRDLPDDAGWGRGDRPVINVSWADAKLYATWLTDQTGEAYRLPTEAEWEYAARAGTRTRFWWDDHASKDGKSWANCDACGSEWDGVRTAPVASFPGNAFGLHDTAGNVWEWVEDCWHQDYENAPADGSPWLEAGGGDCGRDRVIRGGSWNHLLVLVRPAARFGYSPDMRSDYVGFRLAQDR